MICLIRHHTKNRSALRKSGAKVQQKSEKWEEMGIFFQI